MSPVFPVPSGERQPGRRQPQPSRSSRRISAKRPYFSEDSESDRGSLRIRLDPHALAVRQLARRSSSRIQRRLLAALPHHRGLRAPSPVTSEAGTPEVSGREAEGPSSRHPSSEFRVTAIHPSPSFSGAHNPSEGYSGSSESSAGEISRGTNGLEIVKQRLLRKYDTHLVTYLLAAVSPSSCPTTGRPSHAQSPLGLLRRTCSSPIWRLWPMLVTHSTRFEVV